jgi:hypothetical protein
VLCYIVMAIFTCPFGTTLRNEKTATRYHHKTMSTPPQDLYDPLEQQVRELLDPVEMDYSVPGDLVMILPAGSEPAIVVRTPRLREDWVPWPDALNIETPAGTPTTIQYRGQFFGISAVRRRGSAVEYHLDPWPEGELHRRIIPYSRDAVLDGHAREAGFRASIRTARKLRVLYPLLGLLPSELQMAVARRYPVDLIAAVKWSCVAEMLFGIYYLFGGGVLGALGSLVGDHDVSYVPRTLLGFPPAFWVAMAPLFLADAIVRWRALARQGRVFGNLLIEALAKLILRD